MGNEQRDRAFKTIDVPGPGTYKEKTFVGEGPKINFSNKLAEIESKVKVPGPGSYSPSLKSIVKSPQANGIGYGNRSPANDKKLASPGPGTYSIQSKNEEGPKYGFSKTTKMKDLKKLEVPGPGAYADASKIWRIAIL